MDLEGDTTVGGMVGDFVLVGLGAGKNEGEPFGFLKGGEWG